MTLLTLSSFPIIGLLAWLTLDQLAVGTSKSGIKKMLTISTLIMSIVTAFTMTPFWAKILTSPRIRLHRPVSSAISSETKENMMPMMPIMDQIALSLTVCWTISLLMQQISTPKPQVGMDHAYLC